MNIRVEYLAQLRDAVGRPAEEIEFADGGVLLDLLSHLADRFGREAAPHLIDAGGRPQCGLLLIVNDLTVSASGAATHVLRPGDTVTLMPPIAGG